MSTTYPKGPSFKRLPRAIRFFLRLMTFLIQIGAAPSPDKMAKTPASKRQQSQPARWMISEYDTTVAAEDVIIDSRGGPLRIRLYKPAGWVEGGPGLLYIHGGGFVMGGLDGCDNICRQIAKRSGVAIASVEYRLAPEDPFPAALEDCEDALRWFVTEKPYGIDPKRVAVGGDSAGGNLTASLMVVLRDTKGPAVKHQLLIYPLVDMTASFPSWVECAGGGVDVAAAKLMAAAYGGELLGDPLLGALAVEDLSNLAPALVITADFDTLRDEAIAYAEKLLEHGVKTQHVHYLGTAHGFLSLPRFYKDANPCFELIAASLREQLAG